MRQAKNTSIGFLLCALLQLIEICVNEITAVNLTIARLPYVHCWATFRTSVSVFMCSCVASTFYSSCVVACTAAVARGPVLKLDTLFRLNSSITRS